MQDEKRTEAGKAVTDEQDRRSLASNSQTNADQVAAAHAQADRDMASDAELTATHPNDDLDESETARLGEDL